MAWIQGTDAQAEPEEAQIPLLSRRRSRLSPDTLQSRNSHYQASVSPWNHSVYYKESAKALNQTISHGDNLGFILFHQSALFFRAAAIPIIAGKFSVPGVFHALAAALHKRSQFNPRFTYNAPIPLGHEIYVRNRDNISIFCFFTITGICPAACTASV